MSDDPLRPPPGKTFLRVLLLPVMACAAIGLVVSLFVHLRSFEGVRLGGSLLFFGLHVGTILLWLIVFLVMRPRVGTSWGHDTWKIIYAGAPTWMRWMTNGFLVYAAVNFAIYIWATVHLPTGAGAKLPPVEVWRGFSGHWMAFFSAGLTALTSAYRLGVSPRKCLAGHTVAPSDNVCPVCGAKIAEP